MGERPDQRRVLLGAHLLEQPERDEQQRRLVVVELQWRQQAPLADPPSAAGLLDVDAGVVAQGGDIPLDGARVHLELLGKLAGGQTDFGLTEPREELDDAELFLSLLIDAWHPTSLPGRRRLRGNAQRVAQQHRSVGHGSFRRRGEPHGCVHALGRHHHRARCPA